MPEGAVYVGRPTIFGNRFVVNPKRNLDGYYTDFRKNIDLWDSWPLNTATEAVNAFREMQVEMYTSDEIGKLRGKDLACWCPLYDNTGRRVPCHADVLLEIANKEKK